MEQLIELGQIVNTNGIKGFLKVVPYTDNVKRFEDLETIFVEQNNGLKEFVIEEVKYSKGVVLLKLNGIDDMTQAEQLKNCYLKIERKDAVALAKDTYFIIDLIGIEVVTDENVILGKIVDVFPTGSNDVYVVTDTLGKQILLPAIADVIKKVDMDHKKMMVHMIDGLS